VFSIVNAARMAPVTRLSPVGSATHATGDVADRYSGPTQTLSPALRIEDPVGINIWRGLLSRGILPVGC